MKNPPKTPISHAYLIGISCSQASPPLVFDKFNHNSLVLQPSLLDRLVQVLDKVLARADELELRPGFAFKRLGLEPLVDAPHVVGGRKAPDYATTGVPELDTC